MPMPLDPSVMAAAFGAAPDAAAAGASGGATIPLTLLLALIPALFGQNRGQRDMTKLIDYLRPKQPMYMSPNLPAVDKSALAAVMNQLGRSGGGWGWPGGGG